MNTRVFITRKLFTANILHENILIRYEKLWNCAREKSVRLANWTNLLIRKFLMNEGIISRENKFLKGAINLWSWKEGWRMERKYTRQDARRDRVLSIVLSRRAQLLFSFSMILRNRFKVKFKNLCRQPRYVSRNKSIFLYSRIFRGRRRDIKIW